MNKLITSIVIVSTLIGFISCQGIEVDTCIQCTSANDRNCLTSPGDMIGAGCPATSNNTCFVHIVNGHVVRGCSDALPNDVRANCLLDVNDCETCIQISARPGVPCNNEVFPRNRLHCHQCEGHLNTTCGGTPNTNPTLCLLFARNDTCVTQRNGETVWRGCASDPLACPQGRCLSCSGNGCNSLNGTDAAIPDTSSAMGHKGDSVMLAFATVLSVYVLKKLF